MKSIVFFYFKISVMVLCLAYHSNVIMSVATRSIGTFGSMSKLYMSKYSIVLRIFSLGSMTSRDHTEIEQKQGREGERDGVCGCLSL